MVKNSLLKLISQYKILWISNNYYFTDQSGCLDIYPDSD